MPKYQLVFSATAQKEIKKLDNQARQRIASKLKYFLDQPDPLIFAKQLIDSKIGDYRFRVGHFRIVFDVNNHNLEVLSVKHRKDIYKR